METILLRLRSKGINISLNDSGNGLSFAYNDAIYDSLSLEEAEKLDAFIDENEADILAHLQNYNHSMAEIIKSTNELVGRLAGERVEIEGKVIEVSELCFVVEAWGLLFQVDMETALLNCGPHEVTNGFVYKLTGTITGLFSQHTKPTYILVEPEKMEYIRTEAF